MPDTNAAYEAPVSRSRQCPVAAVGTAGNDLTTDIAQVDADGVISSVKYIPAAGITGANTNTRKVVLVNKHADGSGATAVATLQFNSGVLYPGTWSLTVHGLKSNHESIAVFCVGQ